MPDTKKAKEQKRPALTNAGSAHVYNPVNMAGKQGEIEEEHDPEVEASKDDYNPVGMAGRKPTPHLE
jgi:hypothetical protein